MFQHPIIQPNSPKITILHFFSKLLYSQKLGQKINLYIPFKLLSIKIKISYCNRLNLKLLEVNQFGPFVDGLLTICP